MIWTPARAFVDKLGALIESARGNSWGLRRTLDGGLEGDNFAEVREEVEIEGEEVQDEGRPGETDREAVRAATMAGPFLTRSTAAAFVDVSSINIARLDRDSY